MTNPAAGNGQTPLALLEQGHDELVDRLVRAAEAAGLTEVASPPFRFVACPQPPATLPRLKRQRLDASWRLHWGQPAQRKRHRPGLCASTHRAASAP